MVRVICHNDQCRANHTPGSTFRGGYGGGRATWICFRLYPLGTSIVYLKTHLILANIGGGGGEGHGGTTTPDFCMHLYNIEQCTLLAMKRAMFYCIVKTDTKRLFIIFLKY